MSRSQDILGLIRGIQLVASASVKTQEAYVKHLWSHSSVRDVIEKNAAQTSECSKRVITNPAQELQNIGNALKETFERSSVVIEGIRQYTASGRSSYPIGDVEFTKDTKSYSSIKNIKNLDIASITLKELENLLAEHNKMRQVNLRLDENFKPKAKKSKKVEVKQEPVMEKEIKDTSEAIVKVAQVDPVPPKPKIDPTPSVANDEKQVENMMKFITDFDRSASTSEDVKSKPEVSRVTLY